MKCCILVSHYLYLTVIESEAQKARPSMQPVKGTKRNLRWLLTMEVFTLLQQGQVFCYISVQVTK